MTISKELTKNKIPKKKKTLRYDPISLILRAGVKTAAALTAAVLIFIIGYILIKGVPYLTPRLFEPVYNSENVSMVPALVNTLLMIALTLVTAVPVGIGSAVYLTEYAKRGNKPAAAVNLAAETLSGIPSIVYGLFGNLFFVKYLKMGLSLISGSLTLSIMILPLIMKTTREALSAVPDAYREGSFGLGAGKLRTVFSIVLPSAAPGILSGVILSIGRIVGESAALIFTAGTVPEMAKNLFSSTRTLAVHMYALSDERSYLNQTYATAVVLLVIVIIINALSELIAKRLEGKAQNEK